MTISKITLLACLVFGISLWFGLRDGKAQLTPEETLVIGIETAQNAGFDGKYDQTIRATRNGIDYEVIEYVSPKGPGYQVIIYEAGGYRQSFGYGPEAEERTYSQTPFVNTTSTL